MLQDKIIINNSVISKDIGLLDTINIKSKDVIVKTLEILILFSISLFICYNYTNFVKILFFSLIFAHYWITNKNNYFYLAFFSVIIASPGGLFSEASIEGISAFSSLPYVSFGKGITLRISEIFFILAFFKSFRYKVSSIYNFEIKVIIKKFFIVILTLYVYLLFISLFYGISFKTFTIFLRGNFFFLYFIIFIRQIRNINDLIMFSLLIFPFTFFELFTQIYQFVFNESFIKVINLYAEDTIIYEEGFIRAANYGYEINIFTLVVSALLIDKAKLFRFRMYFWLVLFTSLLCVINGMTRQLIVVLILFLIFFLIVYKPVKLKYILYFLCSGFLILVIIFFISNVDINKIFSASYDRFISAFEFSGEGVKFHGTLQTRTEERLPKVLNAIDKSFLFGYGFSDEFFEYVDSHIGGWINSILQGGIVGQIFYVYFIYLLVKINKTYMGIIRVKDYELYLSVKLLLISYIIPIILNFTTAVFYIIYSGFVSPISAKIFIPLYTILLIKYKDNEVKTQKIY